MLEAVSLEAVSPEAVSREAASPEAASPRRCRREAVRQGGDVLTVCAEAVPSRIRNESGRCGSIVMLTIASPSIERWTHCRAASRRGVHRSRLGGDALQRVDVGAVRRTAGRADLDGERRR